LITREPNLYPQIPWISTDFGLVSDLLVDVSVEVAAMEASGRDNGTTTASRQLPRPSIDSPVEWRRPILATKRRHPRFAWESWCGAMVAGAAWLLLFGLALFALSTVTRPQSAGSPIDPWDAEIATPVAEPSSSSADVEVVP
jgi:hypothetical protein